MFVILQYWSFVLRLVSALWYERLLRRYAGHWPVELKQALDLGPMEHVYYTEWVKFRMDNHDSAALHAPPTPQRGERWSKFPPLGG